MKMKMNGELVKTLLKFSAIFYFLFKKVSCENFTNNSSDAMKSFDTHNNSSKTLQTQVPPYIEDLPLLASEALQNPKFDQGVIIIQDVVKNNISNQQCIKDMSLVLQAVEEKKRWALEMFDSFPKYPENILHGNLYQLGNFDECIDINSNNNFKGQYCLLNIRFRRKSNFSRPKPPKNGNMALEKNRSQFNSDIIHWAVCLPSTCSIKDAEIFLRNIFVSLKLENFDIFTEDSDLGSCETGKSIPITSGEIIFGVIVGAFLIFTVIATFFHCSLRKNAATSVTKQIIISFSLINTTKRFFHTKPNELNLESICGIKFISMLIIVIGHSLIFIFGGPVANADFFIETSTRIEHSMFINSPIIVDTFLLISGFLMCRLLLIELDKRKGKINFLILYVARYIRLTPAYAVIIGLYVTYLPRFGSGPFWNTRVVLEKERCQKTWWLNLLYINNYIGTDNLCMFQSWYLAVDYHLFILAPFVIYPLWKRPKIGEAILFVCFLTSILIPFTITYIDNLDPTMMGYSPEVEDLAKNFYFVNYYIKTHMRCSAYCIGLFYAYVVHKIQKNSKEIPTYLNVFGWIFALTCGTASISAVVVFYYPDHVPNITENAFYSSLHRVSWSLSVGWTLLACITNNAGVVNKFLSHKFFVTASRLTYCAYLANGLVEVYSIGITRQPEFLGIFELACKTMGHAIVTFAIAFLLCIIFESPIHGMEKILLRDVKKDSKRSTQGDSLPA